MIGCEQLIKEFWRQKSCNSLGVTNVKVKHEVSFCQIIKTRNLDIVSVCQSICLSVYLSIYLSIYLSTYLPIYLSICIYTHTHTHVIMKKCALLVITTMALGIMKYNYISRAQVQELPQSHSGDSQEDTLFHYHMYITLILFLWNFEHYGSLVSTYFILHYILYIQICQGMSRNDYSMCCIYSKHLGSVCILWGIFWKGILFACDT